MAKILASFSDTFLYGETLDSTSILPMNFYNMFCATIFLLNKNGGDWTLCWIDIILLLLATVVPQDCHLGSTKSKAHIMFKLLKILRWFPDSVVKTGIYITEALGGDALVVRSLWWLLSTVGHTAYLHIWRCCAVHWGSNCTVVFSILALISCVVPSLSTYWACLSRSFHAL